MLDFMNNENSNIYNEKCKQKKHITYKKRVRDDGSEYLVKDQEIDIEERNAEMLLEINRLKELMDQQQIFKQKELLDDMTDEDFLNEIEANANAVDSGDFASVQNAIMDLSRVFEKMPKDIKEKYKTVLGFAHGYAKDFVAENRARLLAEKEASKVEDIKKQTSADLQAQIDELQKQLKGENKDNV